MCVFWLGLIIKNNKDLDFGICIIKISVSVPDKLIWHKTGLQPFDSQSTPGIVLCSTTTGLFLLQPLQPVSHTLFTGRLLSTS